MIATQDAVWAFFGVFVTSVSSIIVALIAVLVRQGRMRISVDAINRAVNHQGDDEPTLIERIIAVEKVTHHGLLHRDWERKSLTTLAHHVGARLDPYPVDDDTD